MGNDAPFVHSVPCGSLEKVTGVEIDGVWFFLTDGTSLMDQTCKATKANTSFCFSWCAPAAKFIGLLKTTMDVICMQNSQLESRRHRRERQNQ